MENRKVQRAERIHKPDPEAHLNGFEVRIHHAAGWSFVVGITDFDKLRRRRGAKVHAYVRGKPKHLGSGVGLVKAALELQGREEAGEHASCANQPLN